MALATADAGGRSVGADGPPQGRGRVRVRVLHELRQPQGARAGGQSTGRPLLLLADSRRAGARRRPGRARHRRKSRTPTSRRARARASSGPGPPRRARPSDRPRSCGRASTASPRGSPARPCRGPTLGRVPGPARAHRGLDGRRVPPPRPRPLYEAGRRLDGRATLSLIARGGRVSAELTDHHPGPSVGRDARAPEPRFRGWPRSCW